MSKPNKFEHGVGWAWAIEHDDGKWSLCHWAEPSKDRLTSRSKPSPEARAVYVYLTPVRAGLRAAKKSRK